MTLKKLRKSITGRYRHEYGLLLIAAFLVVFVAAYLININHQLAHPKQNTYIQGRAEPDEAYKDMNLSVAAKATYTSTAITNYKDLGMVRDVRHIIVRFKVPKDDLVESAMLTLPTTAQPTKGYPVIILCHGYVNPVYYSTEKAYLGDMEFYSQHGYAVVKPDFRGQGFSISAGAPEGAYYSMAYNTDVMSLIAAVKKTPYLDKNHINLWGHSLGAYIAMRASVLSPDIKNTILLAGPVASFRDMYTAYVAISDTNNAVAAAIRAAQLTQHGTPISNPQFWDNASPINYAGKSKSFYQIHVGTADATVPPQFSSDLDRALAKDGIKHEYFVYPGADHGLVAERDSIWSRSLDRMNSTK